jgi:pimeloyl-ACP methyl ester carboxylesterase
VQCGYLSVPEDHTRPQGSKIRLAIAIFKSASAHPKPDPVVYLQGGPGGPLVDALGPSFTSNSLAAWPGDRDLILLDQRGTGNSQPSLACPELTTMAHARFVEAMRACHDRLVREGINLNDYTTLQSTGDVHDLVQALGYRQANLYSISYGTRLALTVMRLSPSDVRSVVLDSVFPPPRPTFSPTWRLPLSAPSLCSSVDVLKAGHVTTPIRTSRPSLLGW